MDVMQACHIANSVQLRICRHDLAIHQHSTQCITTAMAMQLALQHLTQPHCHHNAHTGQLQCTATFDMYTVVMHCPHAQLATIIWYTSCNVRSGAHIQSCCSKTCHLHKLARYIAKRVHIPISLHQQSITCTTWPYALPNSKSRSVFSGVHISQLCDVESQQFRCSGQQKQPMSPDAKFHASSVDIRHRLVVLPLKCRGGLLSCGFWIIYY